MDRDAEMLSALGRKGRELVQASGSLDSMVEGYSNLIETNLRQFGKETESSDRSTRSAQGTKKYDTG